LTVSRVDRSVLWCFYAVYRVLFLLGAGWNREILAGWGAVMGEVVRLKSYEGGESPS
jgi:hypothetical protein